MNTNSAIEQKSRGERPRVKVLQVEDSESDAAIVLRVLTKAGFQAAAERVEDAEGFRAALMNGAWDVILADYRLPQFDAPAALKILRETGMDIPFIVISGAIGEDVAVEIMKMGAQDYLLKGNLARLGPAITREMQETEIRRERRRQEEVRLRLLQELDVKHQAQQQTLHELEAALAEKTVLLKEIHHRVKNNLAVVSSLLGMKADVCEIPEAKQALEESQQRVRSIALVHELLYASNKLDRVNVASYAEEVMGELRNIFAPSPSQVAVRVEAEPVEIPVNQAIPCALILNELATNAFKYAFPNGRSGELVISFRDTGSGCLELAVEDNGVGCEANAGQKRTSLGMKIVSILTRQLNGSLKQEPRQGTRFVLRFPMQTAAGHAQLGAAAERAKK